jgi:GNAT superfamily N-acetyltransferase
MIRAMELADVPRGLALCRASGWNQVGADWEQLLALGGLGCFVAEIEGRVAGTVTTVIYEGRFAWIGMVLVDPVVRGRGIGTALMDRALEALGDLPARLDATPKGYPIYRRLGFVEEARFSRWTREAGTRDAGGAPRGDAARRAQAGVRPMRHSDLDEVAASDRAVFGADRGQLLAWAFSSAPTLAWVSEDASGIRGYAFGRRGHHWWQAGPVVADDVATGAALVTADIAGNAATPLVVDAAAAVPGWTELLAGAGFVEQRPFIRMRRGAVAIQGQPHRQLAIFGPEWG